MVKQNTTKDDHLYLCLERWETKLVFRVNINLLHRSSSLLSMHTYMHARTHTHTHLILQYLYVGNKETKAQKNGDTLSRLHNILNNVM